MQLLPDEQGLTMWADADTENNAEARALGLRNRAPRH